MTAVKTRQDRFGRTHRRLLVLSVALAIAVAAAVSTTWAHEGPVGFRVLIVQHAANGTLQTVPGRSDLRLTLNGVVRQTTVFESGFATLTGRAARIIPSRHLWDEWEAAGFRAAPPYVAITLLNGQESANVVVGLLTSPVYDSKRRTLTARLRLVDDSGDHFDFLGNDRDTALPRRFSQASLMIDTVSCEPFEAERHADRSPSSHLPGGGSTGDCT